MQFSVQRWPHLEPAEIMMLVGWFVVDNTGCVMLNTYAETWDGCVRKYMQESQDIQGDWEAMQAEGFRVLKLSYCEPKIVEHAPE